jgi:methyl-accepting chemotaxis protein
VTLVAETGSALELHHRADRGPAQTIDEIANSAEVQARDLAEINTVVSEMERMTQQNAAMVEKARRPRSLNDQARTLDSAIGRFNMGGGHQQSGFDRRRLRARAGAERGRPDRRKRRAPVRPGPCFCVRVN